MSRTLCRVLGVAFVLAGLAGFADPNLLGLPLTPAHNVSLVGGLLGHSAQLDATALAPDNILHVLLGAVFLFVGVAIPSSRRASPITRLNLQ